jgi:hypothetical protein
VKLYTPIAVFSEPIAVFSETIPVFSRAAHCYHFNHLTASRNGLTAGNDNSSISVQDHFSNSKVHFLLFPLFLVIYSCKHCMWLPLSVLNTFYLCMLASTDMNYISFSKSCFKPFIFIAIHIFFTAVTDY